MQCTEVNKLNKILNKGKDYIGEEIKVSKIKLQPQYINIMKLV